VVYLDGEFPAGASDLKLIQYKSILDCDARRMIELRLVVDGTTQVTANTTLSLAQLQGLKYKTVADAVGSGNLTWTVQDDGGTANGGVDLLTETLGITVGAVNDAPVRSAGSVNDLTVAEDSGTTSLGLGGLTYGVGGGVDESSQTLTYNVTAVPSSVLGNIVLADGTTVVTANTVYSLAQLKGMQFKTTGNANGGPATFSWSVQDNGGTANGGADLLAESLTITVTAVNDVPVNTVPGAQSISEDTSLIFSSGNGNLISIGDVDSGLSSVSVTLSVGNGIITLAGTTGLTFVSGTNGTGLMTFTGTVANINAALAGMSYTPTTNYNGSDTLTILTDDK